MNEMEFKKWLAETGKQKQLIEDIQKEILELRQQQVFLRELEGTGINDAQKGKQGSDSTATKTMQILEIEEMIVKELLPKLKKLLKRQREAKKMLFGCHLTTEERHIIFLRYWEGKNWNCISNQMVCSKSVCYRLHNCAIKKLLSHAPKMISKSHL